MVHDIDVSNYDKKLWWVSNVHPFLFSRKTSNKISMCYSTKNCVVFIMKVLKCPWPVENELPFKMNKYSITTNERTS